MYSTIVRGYLNIKNNFIDPAFSGIILNILVISSTILSGKMSNPYILIIGTLIANTFQFIRFPFVSKKLGFSHSLTLDVSDKYIKELRLIVIPIFISALISQVSLVIDNSMASAFFGVSSISKLFYAKAMLNFIMGVVTLSVTTVTFPDIAKAGRYGDMKILNSKVSSAIVFSMLLVIPATLGMMALSNPIIKFAFERNAFTSYDTEVVASLLVSYGPYIIFTSIIKILSNGFYSIEDSKTPLIAIVFQLVLNIILNVILSKLFGLDGLAYATSVSTAISSVLMLYIFNKRFGSNNKKKNIKSIIKILLSSILMVVVAITAYSYLSVKFPLVISLIVSVMVSGIVYITCIWFSKIDEVDDFRNEFVNKLKNR